MASLPTALDNRARSPATAGLRIVTKIARLVAQTTGAELPQVLAAICCAAREGGRITRASVYIVSHIANELYAVEQGGPDEGVALPERVPLGAAAAPVELLASLPADEAPPYRISDSLLAIPLLAAKGPLGLLYLQSNGDRLELDTGALELLHVLAHQASIAIERRNRELDANRLTDWRQAFSRVLNLSKALASVRDEEGLLQAIADSALAISRADFVVLYEFFAERGDVRIPPFFAGKLRHDEVLSEKGRVVPHKHSAIFRIAKRNSPFFAANAPAGWINEGLVQAEAAASRRSFFRREGVVSSAGIPLRIDQELVGLLFLNYRRSRTFGSDFQKQFSLFADQAALAIGNARFFLRSVRYGRNFETLNEIGRELGSATSHDIKTIARLIESQTQRVIDLPNFSLCLYDPSTGNLSLQHIHDQHDNEEAITPGLNRGLAAYVCRTGKPLLADREHQQQLFSEGEAELVGTPSAIWLGAPMQIGDKTIGALFVQDYDNPKALTAEDRDLLVAIAAHAAIVLDNSRLLREAGERVDELNALLQLSQNLITGTQPLGQLLSSVLDDICRLTACDGSFLFLRDLGELTVAATSEKFLDLSGKSLRFGEGVAGIVAQTKQRYIRYGYRHWEHRAPFADKAKHPLPERVCGFPLLRKDELLGVVTLSSTTPGSFTDHDFELLERFAGPLAMVIQNVHDSSFRQALLTGGPTAIVAIDRNGRISEFSGAAGDILGFERAELLGTSVVDLYWNGLDEARRIGALLRHSARADRETFGKTKDNEKVPLLLSAARIESADHKWLGSVGVLTDLRLTALPDRIRQLIKAIGEMNEAESIDEIAHHAVLHAAYLLGANSACLFVRENDVLVMRAPFGQGESDLAQFDSEDVRLRLAEIADCGLISVCRLPDPAVPEMRLSAGSVSSMWVPIATQTRFLALLLLESRDEEHFNVYRDLLAFFVSQAAIAINRIQLLQERERTLQGLMVSANAIMVGQIATSFIHEAKNALSSMTATIDNLRDDLDREVELKNRKNYTARLATVEQGYLRIDDLARRLQRFTRQGLRPEKSEAFLNEVVRALLVLIADELRCKNLNVDEKLASSLDRPAGKGRGHPILIDELQIQQVLINLILNAIAASHERGHLKIETYDRDSRVEVRVTDYGRGIAEEERRRLFEPFFTTKEAGVGLGLFISKILVVENHQGTIELKSSPGKGTTFSVLLPKMKSERGRS